MVSKKKRSSVQYWGAKTHDREVGKAIMYPEFALINAMLKNAVFDLRDTDGLKSFSSLCWWIEEKDGGAWLKLLDLYSANYFDRLVESEGRTNGKERQIG